MRAENWRGFIRGTCLRSLLCRLTRFSDVNSGDMVTSGTTCCTCESETKLGMFSEHDTGTDMGYVCLLNERGDDGTFTNTLWEVRCIVLSLATRTTIQKTRTVTD